MSQFFILGDFFCQGKVCVTPNGYDNIKSLCNIVMNKHYNYIQGLDREDLVSVGVLKCLELLKDGNFDSTRSSLKNYLYTGIRNEMKNYLYRTHKELIVEDDILYGVNESIPCFDVNDEPLLTFDYCEVSSVIRNKEKLAKVVSSLSFVGFTVKEAPCCTGFYKEVSKEMALVVWNHLVK